jgi:excisionase family DNA binding protein
VKNYPENVGQVRQRFLSVKEMSEWLGIKSKTIYDWVQTQRIPHRKLGSRVLFCPEEVQQWLDTLQRGPSLRHKVPRETASATKRYGL